ncbi:MAG TPA: enolase C-terminal domain-like protein [Dehalococcoidia bacterium]|nr:enolase C-terminal domain-like protein [Dehalococcoidia bacterium]
MDDRDDGFVVVGVDVSAYTIPTDGLEADGTLEWDETTLVLVELTSASGITGLGFSYTSAAAALVVRDVLANLAIGRSVHDLPSIHEEMVRAVRNIGRAGVVASAIAAVDVALWDLRARLHDLPLFRLLGAVRHSVPLYGSGGFTSYEERRLVQQLTEWAKAGIAAVKMKVGLDGGKYPDEDLARVRSVRQALPDGVRLFVDANGAYETKLAIRQANRFAEQNVSYFEEPVSSDHLSQMAAVRAAAPMPIAAGEYAYDEYYFRRMLESDAVDILQADATRCLGISGFLQGGQLAHSFAKPFSAHTAPSIHAHAACAVPSLEHVEYFHDHVRIEGMLFDGVLEPRGGLLYPDPKRPGLGLEFKRAEAERWRVI